MIEKDTIRDSTAFDLTVGIEEELDELAEATGIVIVYCFGISQSF